MTSLPSNYQNASAEEQAVMMQNITRLNQELYGGHNGFPEGYTEWNDGGGQQSQQSQYGGGGGQQSQAYWPHPGGQQGQQGRIPDHSTRNLPLTPYGNGGGGQQAQYGGGGGQQQYQPQQTQIQQGRFAPGMSANSGPSSNYQQRYDEIYNRPQQGQQQGGYSGGYDQGEYLDRLVKNQQGSNYGMHGMHSMQGGGPSPYVSNFMTQPWNSQSSGSY